MKPDQKVDILIAGAGFAGRSRAIALRQALGGALQVIVADPAAYRKQHRA